MIVGNYIFKSLISAFSSSFIPSFFFSDLLLSTSKSVTLLCFTELQNLVINPTLDPQYLGMCLEDDEMTAPRPILFYLIGIWSQIITSLAWRDIHLGALGIFYSPRLPDGPRTG